MTNLRPANVVRSPDLKLLEHGNKNENHYQITLMPLTRIDRVIQAMTQPAIAQAKRSHLLASLENSEGMRSYEGDKAKAQPMECEG